MTADRDEGRLDRLLQDARGAEPVSDALMARVLADAAMVQAAAARRPVPRAAPGWIARMLGTLGGWPAVSGVTLAGVAGLAFGILAPDLVDGLSGGQIGIWSGDTGMLPEIGLLWEEGFDV